ncbi:hypothetical protein, partial [Paraburkholderia atlantica]|uniref:hypothetical protein n=1 Tax=Paraburkholderia atlantica TaxID=2654982 RepID=UPI001C84C45E
AANVAHCGAVEFFAVHGEVVDLQHDESPNRVEWMSTSCCARDSLCERRAMECQSSDPRLISP